MDSALAHSDAQLSTGTVKELTTRLQRIEETLQDIESNTRHDKTGAKISSVTNKDIREKTTVLIRSNILRLWNVDPVEQVFSCELWLSASWKEPGLKGKQGQEVNWDEEWNPDISFRNVVNIDAIQKDQHVVCEQEDDIPFAQETYKVTATFKGVMDLSDFPLDSQELVIELLSGCKDNQVHFEKDMRAEDTVRPQALAANREWQLSHHVVFESLKIPGEDFGIRQEDHPAFHLICHVTRKSGYYLWNVGLVMLLVGALALTSFAVPLNQTADRLIITFLLLLMAVALKFAVSNNCLSTAEQTLVDKYTLSCIVFVVGISVESAVAAIIPSEDKRRLFDKVCFYFAIAFFLLIQLSAAVFATLKVLDTNRTLKSFDDSHQVTAREVERLRRERAWYAEKRQKSKSAQSLSRSISSSQDGIERNHASPSAPILSGKSYV